MEKKDTWRVELKWELQSRDVITGKTKLLLPTPQTCYFSSFIPFYIRMMYTSCFCEDIQPVHFFYKGSMKSPILLYILPKNKCKNIYPGKCELYLLQYVWRICEGDVRKWQRSKVKHLQSTRSGSQIQVSPMLNHAELDS